MASTQPQDTGAPSDEHTSPQAPAFDSAELRDLARSIIGQPPLRDFTAESTQQALRQASVPRMSDASREQGTEAVLRLATGLWVRVNQALAGLTYDDWTVIARELMEDAQMVAEEVAAG